MFVTEAVIGKNLYFGEEKTCASQLRSRDVVTRRGASMAQRCQGRPQQLPSLLIDVALGAWLINLFFLFGLKSRADTSLSNNGPSVFCFQSSLRTLKKLT